MTMIIHSDNDSSSSSSGGVDYDEEGLKLLARVHLEATNDDDCGGKRSWRKLNAKSTLIYRDPTTGGTIHVGNAVAARSLDILDAMTPSPCRKIVYCQGSNKFEQLARFRNNPEFEYFHFPIAQWKRDMGYDEYCDDQEAACLVLEYFQPLFDFLDHEMACGNSVLIHLYGRCSSCRNLWDCESHVFDGNECKGSNKSRTELEADH